MTDPRWLLALDFGGTKLSAGLARAGEREWQDLRRAASPSDARSSLSAMLEMARQTVSSRTLTAVGVSFGGPVDAAAGLVLRSMHVPGWANLPLRDRLQAELHAPVGVDNDANLGALGEWQLGAGRGCGSLLYVTVSTGVGGGWIFDGRVLHGADSMAGEIGHMIIEPGGPACVCGRRGCVEALAAGPSIARNAREQLQAQPQDGKVLRELADGDLTAITAQHVARAAEAGDKLACRILEAAARALGKGLANAITLMNPQRVILGGGVTESGEQYWRAVRQAVRDHVLAHMTVDIVPAALGHDAPLWGGILLATQLV